MEYTNLSIFNAVFTDCLCKLLNSTALVTEKLINIDVSIIFGPTKTYLIFCEYTNLENIIINTKNFKTSLNTYYNFIVKKDH